MQLYLFDRTEAYAGVLDDYYDAVHHEVLNGENSFSFSIYAGADKAGLVVEGNLVGFKDLDNDWQLFEIKQVTDIHSDKFARQAYCEHICYELLGDVITGRNLTGTATAALTAALQGTRWHVGTVSDLGINSTAVYYDNALAAVQMVAGVWSGEFKWRCTVNGGEITRYCDLLSRRGRDIGKRFAYSRDVISIEREVDTSDLVTALYGRGKGVEAAGGGYARRLSFSDVVWSAAGGDPVDKPLNQEWVGDSAALADWGRPGGRHRFGVFTDDNETDAAVLLQKTWNELQARKQPRVTYELDVVSLEQLAGYAHEAVRLGDTVKVIDRSFKPAVTISTRVVQIKRNLTAPTKTNLILGSFTPTITDSTISTQQQVAELADSNLNANILEGTIPEGLYVPAVITQNLYADMGDVAELRVDWLATENRIQRYLNHDVTDMPYTDIHGQVDQRIIAQVVMSGTTPQTEQLRNRNDAPLYWDKSITGATITDGYPYIDGVRVTTTAEVYDKEGNPRQPVTVYQYNLYAKLKIGFGWDAAIGEYVPQIVMGAGSSGTPGQENYGKFFITKTPGGAELVYRTDNGTEVPLTFTQDTLIGDGWVDAKMRKPVTYDFSGLANGQFSETVEGGITNNYSFTRDEDGRINSITDGDGDTVVITW